MKKIQDHYFKLAKQKGILARSYFKLEEIDNRLQILKKNHKVLDLGCVPGSWMQYTEQKIGKKGHIIGVDLKPCDYPEKNNITILEGDCTSPEILNKIKLMTPSIDVILSDMAPSTSGIRERDAYLSYELGLSVLRIAHSLLKEQGSLIFKNLEGEETQDLLKEFKKHFKRVKPVKPKASRPESREIYFVGLQFKKQA